MSDLRLKWTAPFAGDLRIVANDLEIDDGLETAVVLSLFTDRRANDGDALPTASSDRRGWWGDAAPAVTDDQFGSRLWLLGREKQEPAVLERAKTYAEEALAWLVTDGVAQTVTVTAEFTTTGMLGLLILIDRPEETSVTFNFGLLWAAQASEAA
jgi:phage gp46-like protein